ncbi:MAG: hypothetical protein IM600_13995 [Bacteroidetes bacterium]|nr:hypothetical protein [Bacteroidota bacterium]MCA6444539.1 hypothetical protein [Bacteroidota bacterium]
MKNQKTINALKAFEIKSTEKINGGWKRVVCVGEIDGVQHCDIYNSVTNTTEYDVVDRGLRLGETWG